MKIETLIKKKVKPNTLKFITSSICLIYNSFVLRKKCTYIDDVTYKRI